jgi:hypothetical protein
MVTLASVARALNRATPTLVRWSERGAFPPYTIIEGRRYVFAADYDAWLKARRDSVQRCA